MNVSMRWTGEANFERVARTRAFCYGNSIADLPQYESSLRVDKRAVDGDYLLAEIDGRDVGTATSLSMNMWITGARIACQGIAWVGTIKTHRRGVRGPVAGIATQVMREAIRLGRERGQVVSALMPFRGSFYEHFGYGIVEHHSAWTVPLALFPTGAFDGLGFYEPTDRAALLACRQRQVESGQCDIERSEAAWDIYFRKWNDGLIVVDRTQNGGIRGYVAFQHVQKNEKDIVTINEAVYDDLHALQRLFYFLGTLKDQYSSAILTLPLDLPVNWMLRETQLPHRLVNHLHAQLRPYTRMSLRVLDHRKLLESMHFPSDMVLKHVIGVRECEGHLTRFELDISNGKATATPTEKTVDFECPDRVWSAIVCGALKTSASVKLGLADTRTGRDFTDLDAFSRGPAPFCQEYF